MPLTIKTNASFSDSFNMENSKQPRPYLLEPEGEKTNGLEELDLFEVDSSSPVTETDLSSTAQAFSSRMQRKIKEQEKALSIAEEETKTRHHTMLKALMGIRRSLTDVTRIDLGERFKFMLQADDWNGWPRLTIRLQDKIIAGSNYPIFQVTAHDRKSRGIIELIYNQSDSPEIVSFAHNNDLKRLAMILKKCVRSYLDLIGEIVLNADNDSDEHYDNIESSLPEEQTTTHNSNEAQLSGDLFEESFDQNVLESLPEIDDLESLPELD